MVASGLRIEQIYPFEYTGLSQSDRPRCHQKGSAIHLPTAISFARPGVRGGLRIGTAPTDYFDVFSVA